MAECESCGGELVQGRGRVRRTCSAACRQKAHRRRQATEVERLKELAARPAPLPEPRAAAVAAAGVSRNEPGRLEGGGAGLPDWLRALWADLGSAVEWAALHAESGWADSESGVTPDDIAFAIRHRADKLAEAVLASVESSRNESSAPAEDEAANETPAPGAEGGEPVVVPPPSETPAAAKPSRNEQVRPMSQKKAREFTAGAHMVSRDRETHHYEVVTSDGTVVGHVEPSYKAGRRYGWNGWAEGSVRSSTLRTHATRDEAGADALGQWIRTATAKPRR